MKVGEQVLDVSTLEPPYPMERVLDRLKGLQPGAYLRVLHRREPFPLYPMLEQRGFAFMTRAGRATAYEIYIWRREDQEAEWAVGESALDSAVDHGTSK